ncbi:MAG: helix-turn-helix domain-containing protein [Clostridiales bacterium]|jgi:transcriptional regulator with XRE-family HTH domain|nr:helix-turn-helix domain-containing protein [Clostridiales bacterium]
MTIGERIKKRRLELGISATQLAEKLNKDRTTIFRYENGYIENMPIGVLEPLAIALRTTPEYLMGWTDSLFKGNVPIVQLPPIVEKYNMLNKDGKDRVEAYINDLLASGNYGDDTAATAWEKSQSRA